MPSTPFYDIARLTAPGDNVAIAIRRLEAATSIALDQQTFDLQHTVLEGHRFAISAIPNGAQILSWGLPFAIAIRDIQPGEYMCNELILESLRGRRLDMKLPDTVNFEDYVAPYTIDTDTFSPGTQVPLYAEARTFNGFERAANRGVGTRNFIVILATSSRTGALAKRIAASIDLNHPNIDGIVPVAHTEGGSRHTPNNRERILRTLAGWLVHPNVGAVLALDMGDEPIDNNALRSYLESNDYPWHDHPVAFQSVSGSLAAAEAAAVRTVTCWLDTVNKESRTPQSVAHLNFTLQCGGSDAFSGVSANPLLGWLSREVIRYGGKACIAETTELIGAEPYMLSNVRDLATAEHFLQAIKNFRELAGWHGHTAEGNPSGGNRMRGLYNIIVKSIGAARKKAPDVRLDYSIDYSEPMHAPGYYFMDSPGNDLESIAGQVAGGGNVIFFTTGNGSITNFPFVPTLKVVTTTGRYDMLRNEMDINAGTYLEGVDMDTLGRSAFEETIAVANGKRTAGERAGHSQVQIWRDWLQTPESAPLEVAATEQFSNEPATIDTSSAIPWEPWTDVPQRVGLILPNSLCSSQVAAMIAGQLEKKGIGRDAGVTRYVALPHTEGCGCAATDADDITARTLTGYLVHPLVQLAVLLEHGCEKFHNDFFHGILASAGVDSSHFGWGSIQLDGGIVGVKQKIEDWIVEHVAGQSDTPVTTIPCCVGIYTVGAVDEPAAKAFAMFAATIVTAGGTVVMPRDSSILGSSEFCSVLSLNATAATLSYGSRPSATGLYIMDAPMDDDVEIMTGLGATGVQVIWTCSPDAALQAHPLVPMLQGTTQANDQADLHFADSANPVAEMLALAAQAVCGEYVPKMLANGMTAFQLSRGRLGCSL